MSPDAQGCPVDAVRPLGGIDLDDVFTDGTHGQAAAHRAESADGQAFSFRAARIAAVFGGQGTGGAHADAGSAKSAAGLFQALFMDGGRTGAKPA